MRLTFRILFEAGEGWGCQKNKCLERKSFQTTPPTLFPLDPTFPSRPKPTHSLLLLPTETPAAIHLKSACCQQKGFVDETEI